MYSGGRYYNPNDYFSSYSPTCMDRFTCAINPGLTGFRPCETLDKWMITYQQQDNGQLEAVCQSVRNPDALGAYRNRVYALRGEVQPLQQPPYVFGDGYSCWAHLCGFPEEARTGKRRAFRQCHCRVYVRKREDGTYERVRQDCRCKPIYAKPAYYEDRYGVHLAL